MFDTDARHCALCAMWMRESQWDDHLIGRKHRRNSGFEPRRGIKPRPSSSHTAAGAREVISAFIRLDLAMPEETLPLELRFVHRYLLAGVVPARRADYMKRHELRQGRWGRQRQAAAAEEVADARAVAAAAAAAG